MFDPMKRHAIRAGEAAFFAAVASSYPTASSGDLAPEVVAEFHTAAINVATEWISANVPTREQLWRKLCEHYGADPDDTCLGGLKHGDAVQRFAAVALEFDLGQGDSRAALASWPTFEEACDVLGSAVLDGYAPEAVYDLDRGERLDIHIASPVITLADDQMGENVLQPQPELRGATPK